MVSLPGQTGGGYQSPLSTLSRSTKFRLPSPSGTSSGTATDHSSGSSSRHSSGSRISFPGTPVSNGEKSDLNLDDTDDDEPVTQAPQLSALARMLLSESPKSSAKAPPSPPTTSALRQQGPFTSKPRQKLSWGTTTEYAAKTVSDEPEQAASPKDEEGPSYQSARDFVTPAPRPRAIRPFTGSYYTSSSGDGYTEPAEYKEGGITTNVITESAVRSQLGSAARWSKSGRGLMSGLSGAPRRGQIRRESSDPVEKDRVEEASQEPASYSSIRRRSMSPAGSPLQRASRSQVEEEEKQSVEPRELALPRSRESTPELQRSRRATPELQSAPEPRDDINNSPTPQENVRPSYARFSRSAPSLSTSGSAVSLRSTEPAPASQSQAQSATGKMKNPITPTTTDEEPQRPSSPIAINKVPKMGSLARTPSPSPDRDRARRDALMNRDRNTPLRPAPPPPKMNIVNAATAIAGAQSTQQSKQRRGNVIINKRQYRRLDAIGKGGSSKVYKVMAENFKVFAMKKVTFSNEEDGQAAILGYKGEIELLKKLEKVDRVIRLFDYEINDERGCLLMLMECGETDLAKLIQMHYAAEGAILDISFTRHYWREMLLCVQAVHELNIIHSDLKPANFLVVQGRLKLIDFGIANAIVGDTVNVHRESQVGTVNYMSPEALTDVNASPTGRAVQSVGGNKLMKLGAPSDVWSLGCILYQMVYGRPPFANLQTIFQKLAAIPNPRHEIQYPETGIGGASVPLSVIGTMQDCLERDKNDRATIAQLLSDDNAFLNPDKRKEGTVEITEDALKRLLENVVEHTTKGDMLDKNAIKAWAHSIYGKLEVQQRKRPPRMRP